MPGRMKTARKVARKKSTTPNITIDLGTDVVPVSQEGPKKVRKIRWHNSEDFGKTVRFTDGWPFTEPPQDILVPANGKSGWFNVYADVTEKSYPYDVLSMLDGGPGGGPDIVIP